MHPGGGGVAESAPRQWKYVTRITCFLVSQGKTSSSQCFLKDVCLWQIHNPMPFQFAEQHLKDTQKARRIALLLLPIDPANICWTPGMSLLVQC